MFQEKRGWCSRTSESWLSRYWEDTTESPQPVEENVRNFEFTAEEVEILRELLRHGLDEINLEVFRTDTHNFKDMLKQRQRVMEQVLDKLSLAPAEVWH